MNRGDWQKRAPLAHKECDECGKVYQPRLTEYGYEGEIMFSRRRFCSPSCSAINKGQVRYQKEQAQAEERERRKTVKDAAIKRFLYNK